MHKVHRFEDTTVRGRRYNLAPRRRCEVTHPKITVVGSYATGLTIQVDRLPIPGETVLGSGYRVDHGGKGSNQAVGCARLGAEVCFISCLGQDTFADMALKLYRDEGIDTRFVRQTSARPTGVGFILVEAATGNNCIALDPGANELLSAIDLADLGSLKDAAIVLTQLEIPVSAAEAALACGRRSGATTILNPAPVRHLPESVLEKVDVLTPNRTEANVLTGRKSDAQADPETVARDLIRQGVKTVIMTLGDMGALIVTESSSKAVRAIEAKAVDSTGAGDAFNAGLATALAFGQTLEAAVDFAVVTGGLAVTKPGVIPSLPLRQEVTDFYKSSDLQCPDWFISTQQTGNH